MTATLTIPSRESSSAAISASMADLLSASVPSRSKTMSFFTALRNFRKRNFQHVTVPLGRHEHAPTTAGRSSTSPSVEGIIGAGVLQFTASRDAHQHATGLLPHQR